MTEGTPEKSLGDQLTEKVAHHAKMADEYLRKADTIMADPGPMKEPPPGRLASTQPRPREVDTKLLMLVDTYASLSNAHTNRLQSAMKAAWTFGGIE